MIIAGAGANVQLPISQAAPRQVDPFHQLPSPPRDFTGRANELRALREAVAKPGASGAILTGVNGMGGVGKTALALQLAHELKPDFPHADFFLDLRGVAIAPDKPVPPEEALQHIIRAFSGPEAKLPADLPTLKSLYHSCLAGKRAIILWDNAKDAAQVKDLIPPAGCLMLVTSRASFTLAGMKVEHLDKLPEPDAVKLLQSIAASASRTLTDADAKEIAKLCGCLPQALRLAGGGLASRADLTTVDLIRRLRERDQALKVLDRYKDDTADRSLRASMQMTEGLLPEEVRPKWHALAVFPSTFDTMAAAAIWSGSSHEMPESAWQIAIDHAADLLSDLVRANAVEFSEAIRRYSLHDLIRVYVTQTLTPVTRVSAERRFAEHYAALAKACNSLYQTKGQHRAALALFDVEWANVVASFELAEPLIEFQPWAAEVVKTVVGSPYCLELRLAPQRKPLWLYAGLQAAKASKDRYAEGAALGNLGNAYAAFGDARKAIEFYEQAQMIMREIGDRSSEGSTLGSLGSAYIALGDVRKAIAFFDQHLVIAREVGDRLGEGNTLGNLGLAYATVGDENKAVQCYEQHLMLARELGDKIGEGNALGNLGLASARLGDDRKAIEFHKLDMAIRQEIGDRRGEGAAMVNLGIAYEGLGDMRKAIEYYRHHLIISQEIGDRRGEGNAMGSLGLAYAKLCDTQKAINCYSKQLAISREIGDRRGEAVGSWNFGLLHVQVGELARAVPLLQIGVDFERDIGHANAERHAAYIDSLRAQLNNPGASPTASSS